MRGVKSILKPFLEPVFLKYHRPEFLVSDPLEFVHRFMDPRDQEIVALVAAVLAYGKVAQIRKSLEDLLGRIARTGRSPGAFAREFLTVSGQPRLELSRALVGFVHRFNVGEDFQMLFAVVSRSLAQHGSIGGHFLNYLDPKHTDFGEALSSLHRDWREWAAEGEIQSSSFGYLLTAPADGSCCKRWCMLLRWMGRQDEMDLGLWTENSPLAATFPRGRGLRTDQLVMPLDTHTGRISQYLGLTRRKSLNWKAAVEVTQSLRACDPADPVKYDFALARLGILDLCQRKYRAEICSRCDLLPVCGFARKRRPA